MSLPRRLALVLPMLAIAADGAADPAALAAWPVAFDGRRDGAQSVGELDYLAGYALDGDSAGWGGLSGMAISTDGAALWAVADVGIWYRFELRHNAGGRLDDIRMQDSGHLLDDSGQPIATKCRGDAEALAVKSDGYFYVAFECRHRLWRYRAPGDPFAAPARVVRLPTEAALLPNNSGLEAATFLPGDRLFMLAQDSATAGADLPGWFFDGARWQAVTLARSGAFEPTDMTLLPSGDVLLLERSFSVLAGPRARLSILPKSSIVPGARLAGREIAVIAPPLTVDNFEAVAARPGSDGATLIYLLSDDNQNALQRTLLLQFRLRPPGG
ncbi:MAG: esterase-like activity of phytase family protein [Dongiaceae bacterium]